MELCGRYGPELPPRRTDPSGREQTKLGYLWTFYRPVARAFLIGKQAAREVYLAIRNLLDTTNHIQARAAELENALDVLRQQERNKAFQQILLALRNSQDGDLLRFNPTAQADESSLVKAIVEALIEAFECYRFNSDHNSSQVAVVAV